MPIAVGKLRKSAAQCPIAATWGAPDVTDVWGAGMSALLVVWCMCVAGHMRLAADVEVLGATLPSSV